MSWTPTEDGEIVVLDLRSSRYLSLNPAASALWPLVLDGTTEARLAALLVDRFGIDEATAARDVGSFLSALRDRNLLVG